MIRIALAQINPTVGDLKGNALKIIDFIRKAQAANADIVAFPELAVCGYPPEDLLLKEHFISENIKTLKDIAAHAKKISVIVGFVDRDKKKNIYNAAALLSDRRIKGIYHKEQLPNYGVFDEKRYFTAGTKNPIFSVKGIKFAVNICEDIWLETGPHKTQVKKGAKFLINISSSPYHAGKLHERQALLKTRANQVKAPIFYVNIVGGQDELVFDGASMIFDKKGKTIAAGKQFEEDMIFADIPLDAQTKNKSPRPLGEIEEIYKALTLGTRDYIRKNGFKKVTIGLSGGIDSALVAAIAVDAVGQENVTAVSMPSQYSSLETISDARKIAKNLGIRFLEIPIMKVFSVFLETLDHEFKGQAKDITEENLQARIRGNILMAFSNKFGWLVLTTGNKSEIATGYCTLYGDMAGGFAVIKDVPKTTVYKLAKYRNSLNSNAVIMQSIIDRAPTAELRENQKDQDTLPEYDLLDKILSDYVEADKSLSDINKKINNAKVIKDVMRLVDRSEYKRRQAPPGVKITPRAFGRDRRFPIVNQYREF
ncbi:MAG: NAD+ synthase [Candidatus Omnitrophota bacterium]